MSLVGRIEERQRLDQLLTSVSAEFIAIYGRRRVGKTYLVREHFKKQLCFELTGVRAGKLQDQLGYFHEELERRSKKEQPPPKSWRAAFAQLRKHLESLRGESKRVIFLDEVPWLDSHRSGFRSALDHFWNHFLSRHPRFILIICGSAASWIVKKVVDDKGGLHNRVTAPPIRLEPFTLAETASFLKSRRIKLTSYELITLAMVMGGIPMYLRDAEPGQSAAQIIDASCFHKDGRLRNEFSKLYPALFDHSERHIEIIRELAAHPQGRTRTQLTDAYSSGGRLSTTLFELDEAGFVSAHQAFGKKIKDTVYRLTDEYSLFYLKWIERSRPAAPGKFLRLQQSAGWRAWSGYALEALAFKHLPEICDALGIGVLSPDAYSWVHRPNKTWPKGTQIDLLLDRPDNTINLIEIKFSNEPFTITKSYAEDLRNKVGTFRGVTGTRKNLFLAFLTTHGVTPNAYAQELVQSEITTDQLFT